MPLTPGEKAPLYTKKRTGFIKDRLPRSDSHYDLQKRLIELNCTKEVEGYYFPFQYYWKVA